MQNVINALLNTLFVSLLEEFIWVIFTIVFLGRYDLIDWRRWKRNIKLLSIPVFPVAITINIFRYILIIPRPIMSILTSLILLGLIYYIVKITDRIQNTKFIKVLICVFLGLLAMFIIETLVSPLLLYLSKLTLQDLSENVWLNIKMAIPTRLLQLFLLAFVVYNKIYKLNYKHIIFIFKDKLTAIYMGVSLFITLLLFIILTNLFLNSRFIISLSLSNRILFAITIVSLPILFLGVVIINYMYSTRKIIEIEKRYSNMLGENEQNYM